MTTTNDVDYTGWSPPGPADLPKDELQAQLEVYSETILLQGLRGRPHLGQDRLGGRDRQRVHPAPGLRLGDCCPKTPSGGARGRPARWWPCGARPRSGRWHCNGRRSSLPPGSGCPCRGWSSSAPRAGRPGFTPPWNGPPTRISSSTAPRPSTSSGTGGPAPAATASPRRWDGYPNPSSSPSSPLPEIRRNGRSSTPTTCKPYGRNSMDRLTTRLRTWFPNAPWAASWRPRKETGLLLARRPRRWATW